MRGLLYSLDYIHIIFYWMGNLRQVQRVHALTVNVSALIIIIIFIFLGEWEQPGQCDARGCSCCPQGHSGQGHSCCGEAFVPTDAGAAWYYIHSRYVYLFDWVPGWLVADWLSLHGQQYQSRKGVPLNLQRFAKTFVQIRPWKQRIWGITCEVVSSLSYYNLCRSMHLDLRRSARQYVIILAYKLRICMIKCKVLSFLPFCFSAQLPAHVRRSVQSMPFCLPFCFVCEVLRIFAF